MLDLCLSHVSVMWYGGKVPNVVLRLMTISAVRVHGVSRLKHSTRFPDTCFPGLAIGQRLSWWASVPTCSSPLIAARGKHVTYPVSQVGKGGGQGLSLISLAESLRGIFGPSGKWAASAPSKGWGRTHIANSSRPGTFKRPGAGVAIRAPATKPCHQWQGRENYPPPSPSSSHGVAVTEKARGAATIQVHSSRRLPGHTCKCGRSFGEMPRQIELVGV